MPAPIIKMGPQCRNTIVDDRNIPVLMVAACRIVYMLGLAAVAVVFYQRAFLRCNKADSF